MNRMHVVCTFTKGKSTIPYARLEGYFESNEDPADILDHLDRIAQMAIDELVDPKVEENLSREIKWTL